ncbi:MAG: hypothetical protein ACRD44_04685 [Bryobacteraceae bacterium]
MKLYRGILLIAVAMAVAGLCAGNSLASLKAGKAELKSAGALAFGPDGILFVGDTLGASVYALDTNDRAKASAAPAVTIQGLNEKIASLLGTAPDQIQVNDMAVNPLSKKIYLSVSRGRGPDALPVLLRTTAAGKLEEVSLANIPHSKASLPNAPAADAKDRRGAPLRMEAITDLAFASGKVIVAGLSNEEFSSNLRAIPFPFSTVDNGTPVEIYHGNHGRLETNAPVRTFMPYKIKNEDHILAAYTCTPLVTFKMTDLKPGAKVVGTTIAELGNRNRPLDMVPYRKGNANFILMNNSSRGVMKLKADGLEGFPPITARVPELAGVPYETIADLKGVQQLDAWDADKALALITSDTGAMELKTIPLP